MIAGLAPLHCPVAVTGPPCNSPPTHCHCFCGSHSVGSGTLLVPAPLYVLGGKPHSLSL